MFPGPRIEVPRETWGGGVLAAAVPDLTTAGPKPVATPRNRRVVMAVERAVIADLTERTKAGQRETKAGQRETGAGTVGVDLGIAETGTLTRRGGKMPRKEIGIEIGIIGGGRVVAVIEKRIEIINVRGVARETSEMTVVTVMLRRGGSGRVGRRMRMS